MQDEQRLCLYGDLAKPFIKNRIGDKVTVTVQAVVTSAGLEPDYSGPCMPSKGKDAKPKKRPRVEFVIASVNGKSGKSLADMNDGDMDEEIAKTKRGDYDGDEDA